MLNKNLCIAFGIILIVWYLHSCKETSYFGSGPMIFSADNTSDYLLDNNCLEPVYQKIKLSTYL